MSYEVILNGQYDLQEVTESIQMDESLSDVSLHLSLQFSVIPELPEITEGSTLEIRGVPQGESQKKTLFSGVIWSIDDTDNGGYENISIDVYERTIYLKKSEEEYVFGSGQTASSRIRTYAADWGIPLGSIPDTSIKLAKAIYRSQYISAMIDKDLNETATKGGKLYMLRMASNKLDLFEIGSNTKMWVLENVEEKKSTRSLEDTVTKVKILGKEVEGKRSPIIATVTKDTNKYGTLQRIIQDENITKKADAEAAGKKMLSGVEESYSLRAPGINTLRAGDRVKVDTKELIVISINQPLQSGASMSLQLGTIDYVRRKYFGESSS